MVEVTAEVPVLKFDSPEFGGHLSNQEIENIPINNRRWSALALTTPGVTNDRQRLRAAELPRHQRAAE